MKDKLVGIYKTESHNCRLIITSGMGGSLNLNADDKSMAFIKVGGDEKKFHYVIEALLHEVMEFIMCELQLRYEHAHNKTWAADRYYFFMNHPEFDEVTAVTGEFIESCYADLKKAWLEFKRKPKKKPPKREKRDGAEI